MAGGYLTGRLRRRFHDATEHESDVRDGEALRFVCDEGRQRLRLCADGTLTLS